MGVKIISSAIPRETVDALFWTILFKGCMLVEVRKRPFITPERECQEENEIFRHFNGAALIVSGSPLCYDAARDLDEGRISKKWVCHCQKLSGSQAVRLSRSVFLVIEDEQVDDR